MPVGASPAAVNASVVITVVVVLPWVPDTATDRAPPIKPASACFRGHHRQPERASPRELRMSGRDRRRHDDRAGTFQVRGIVPLPDTRAHGGEVGRTIGSESHPLTTTPRRQAISASALMPAPPIPTKWTGRRSVGLNRFIGVVLM